jgi:WD40 repeat protein
LKIEGKENIITSKAYDKFLFAGTVKGNVLTFDLESMKMLWGFGCMKRGAVSNLDFCEENRTLVVAGDDTSVLMLKF